MSDVKTGYLLQAMAALDALASTTKDVYLQFAPVLAAEAQAAAMISVAEQMGAQNALLATITEHLEFIRSHMDDVGTVLLNAQGADGVIKVDTDGRR